MQRYGSPSDISDPWNNQVIPQQSLNDMHNWMLVSSSWCQFYKTPLLWKKAIESHFGITKDTLNQFENIAFHITAKSYFDYQLLYNRLYILQKKSYPYNFREILKNPDHHLSFLACCFDNVEVARKVLSRQHEHMWHVVVMIADCANIFSEIFYRENEFYISQPLVAGSYAVVQDFITTKLPSFKKEGDSFCKIFSEGNFSNIQYLINHQDLFGFKLNEVIDDLLENKRIPLRYIHDLLVQTFQAVGSSLVLRGYVLNDVVMNRKNESADVANLIQFLNLNKISFDKRWKLPCSTEFIRAGYLDYAKYLITAAQVQLPLSTLIIDALSHTQSLTPSSLKFLFDSANPWALPQNDDSLERIIMGNHYETLLFLLNPENGYQFVLTSKIFYIAASAKNPLMMRYLLEHHTSPTCMPERRAFCLAIRSYRTENARQLLQPAFAIKPTQEHLWEAVNANLVDIVKLLMEGERQPGLKLTADMLKTALVRRHYLTNYHEPQLSLIEFMLEPRFGLKMTQDIFDRLYTDSNRDKSYNKTDVILFLLDKYSLMLTQEKFEQLFCEAGILSIADLLYQYPGQFSYLKPTMKMLHKAIELQNKAHINYFLQPYFGLEVTEDSLELALYTKNEEIFDLILSKFKGSFVPSQTSLCELLDSGQLHFARRLLINYAMEFDDFLVSKLFSLSNAEGLAIALSLVKASNLLGPDKPQHRVSSPGYSLECNELLLDPQNHIHFDLTNLGYYQKRDADMVFESIPAIGLLIKSDIEIKAALARLIFDLTKAKHHFKEACQLSSRQCFRVAAYALAHPTPFHLDSKTQQQLLSMMVETLTPLDQFTLSDLMIIKKHLVNAKTALIKSKEEALANQLPLAAITEADQLPLAAITKWLDKWTEREYGNKTLCSDMVAHPK